MAKVWFVTGASSGFGAELLAQVQDDATLARHLLSLARNGGTEMSLQRAALRDAGIATEPPPGWGEERQADGESEKQE